MYDNNHEGQRNRSRSRSAQRRRRGVSGQPWFYPVLLGILGVLLIAAIILGAKGCKGKTGSIQGRWDLDGATVYEFKADGKGALILTTMTFEFNYTVDGNTVSIDFVDERASDAKYEYVIDDDLLMLTGGPENSKGQHILKRD